MDPGPSAASAPSRSSAVIRPGTTPGCACARTGWRSSAAARWSSSRSPAALGPLLSPYGYEDQRSRSRRLAARRARTGWAPTCSAATCWCASSTAGASPSPSGLSATVVALTIGVVYGAVAGFCRRQARRRDDARRRHPVLPALHDLRDPADGVLRAEHHPALRGHRRRRMADDGPHRPRPGHVDQTHGVRRGRAARWASAGAASSSATSCPTCSARSSSTPR